MGSNSVDTLTYNSSGRSPSVSDKLDTALVIHTELVNALKTHGCTQCKELFHEILKKYGSPSLQATNQQASSRVDLIDTFDIRRR
jgi:hypothetical protein